MNGKGFTDWFLPSFGELKLMCENLHEQGVGSFASYNYWSSSEDGAARASRFYFGGDQYDNARYLAYRVRPVRAFLSHSTI